MKFGDFSVDDTCRRTGTMENSKLRSVDNKKKKKNQVKWNMLLEWLQLLTRNPAYAALLWPFFPFANCSFALSGNAEPS
jgi:hypothetical protein